MSQVITPQVGETYNRLTITKVIGRLPINFERNGKKLKRWVVRCTCDCGSVVQVQYGHLRSGQTMSCGCLKVERIRAANTTHGASRADASWTDRRLLAIWKGMLQRTAEEWRHYVGIYVCDEWKNFANFRDWAKENGWEPGLTIDRIRSTGNYEPGNCRWATSKQQANNRKSNHFITWLGETKTAAQWFEDPRCPVTKDTFYSRLQYGYTDIQAISTPVGRKISAKQRGHISPPS